MSSRPPDPTDLAAPPVRRLLVVDDNPDIHDLFRRMLLPAQSEDAELEQIEAELFPEQRRERTSMVPLHVSIDSAYQGAQAVEMVVAAQEPYALAFVDVRMPPGMDGIQTIKQLWQHAPDLYVVVCTAYSDHSWEGITQFLGSSPNLLILRKPFETIEVRQIVACITTMYDVLARMKGSFDELAAMAVGTATDEALHRARASARATLTGTASLSVGAGGIVIDADNGVDRLIGLPPARVIGRKLSELLEGCADFTDDGGVAPRRARAPAAGKELVVTGTRVEVPPGGEPELLLVLSPT